MKLRPPFDLALPERPAARVAVVAMLVVGGLVALLVPVFFAVMVVGMLRGG